VLSVHDTKQFETIFCVRFRVEQEVFPTELNEIFHNKSERYLIMRLMTYLKILNVQKYQRILKFEISKTFEV
jgi:hypothetical protein